MCNLLFYYLLFIFLSIYVLLIILLFIVCYLINLQCVKRAIHFDEMETEETTHTDADASHRSLPTEGFLTTVKAVTHCLSSQQYSSIVEAIESQGGVLATHLNIVGRVQRVYRRSMASRRREATKTSSCARSLRMEIDQERMQEQWLDVMVIV